jgi:cupin fold WbuC family metalloprotein
LVKGEGVAMDSNLIAKMSQDEINENFLNAINSDRKRFPKILHTPGDEFNRVINFIRKDSYMQPHLHPGIEKIEVIRILRGSAAVVFFDDSGVISKYTILENGGMESIEVPAFTWHTYVMLTDYVITYETMMGVYRPETWKHLAHWAPKEGLEISFEYLSLLRQKVLKMSQHHLL